MQNKTTAHVCDFNYNGGCTFGCALIYLIKYVNFNKINIFYSYSFLEIYTKIRLGDYKPIFTSLLRGSVNI